MHNSEQLSQLVEQVSRIAEQAAEVILPHFTTQVDYTAKADGSPVTLADQAADRLIRTALQALTPDWPILSEEMEQPLSFAQRAQADYLWLVDPLDGTRQFIRGDAGFSVNIALIHRHQPILGVVYAPVDAVGYAAVLQQGAWRWQQAQRQAISVSQVAQPVRVLTGCFSAKNSQRTRDFLNQLGDYQLEELGSSLKICRVAEGSADIYPRYGLTSEWDTAAAHIILSEAGGELCAFETGERLCYNRKASLDNPYFYAVGQSRYPWPLG